MKVQVIEAHLGEGKFPTFKKGAFVAPTDESCGRFLHWRPCEIEGHRTYVPESIVEGMKLTRDYNPTELVQNAGDILEVQEIFYAWLLAKNKNGVTGWIPAEKVVSVD